MKLLASVCGGVAVLGIVCIALGQDKDAAKKDVDMLQGTWRVISGQNEDVPYSKEDLNNGRLKMTFAGDKCKFKDVLGERAASEGTFTVNPAHEPKRIDLSLGKQTLKGVYVADKNGLKICMNDSLENDKYPTNFTAKVGSKTTVVILEREKP